MNRKKLAIVTGSEATKETLCNQMRYFLEDCIDIEGFSEEIQVKVPIKADLVVMSSKILAEEMAEYVSPECPVLIANRSLNIENMEKLFGIPKGTKVFFVNDIRENVFGCIESLKEIGIDYIDFIPYYPGCRIYRTADIAVTAGETALVPENVEKIIDLGARIIDISSIIEILKHFDLMDEKLNLVSAKYKETMIRFSNNLYHLFTEASRMNQYLARILNQINDGIIAFSSNGIISIFNEKSKEIFGVHAEGELIDTAVPDKTLREYLLSIQDMSDKLFHLDNSDFIISKFRIEKIDTTVCTIKNTKENKDIEVKLRQNLIKKGYFGKYRFSDIIASSPVMQDTIHIAKKLAKTDLNILIYGESGVGKELFASAIHNESKRNRGPFVAINFSALSEDLVESELFGYEEGAFTGAKKGGKLGIFEQANQGTIFLDEVGDISPKIQARLLRVLQEREIRRVGGSENIPIDVRVITATNKNLVKMCQEGTFREDLYHRLKKFYLKIPPLKSRPEDIDALVKHFLKKHGREKLAISEEVMEILRMNRWNGNVRELENVIEYFIAVSEEQTVRISDLPEDFFEDPVRHHTDYASYDEVLCEKGNLDEYLYIMKTIRKYTDKGLTMSRRTLTELAKENYPYITEERIRKKTNDLQELKLITKSVGRIGMRLTLNGVKYINNFLQYPPIDS
jgi:sigma-54 dependent transcriptional regulator, acetoin dehydrogenase operon transcriptional activator AcoR